MLFCRNSSPRTRSGFVLQPFAGAILGDLGAEVLKIERVDGGDDARAAWGRIFVMAMR